MNKRNKNTRITLLYFDIIGAISHEIVFLFINPIEAGLDNPMLAVIHPQSSMNWTDNGNIGFEIGL